MLTIVQVQLCNWRVRQNRVRDGESDDLEIVLIGDDLSEIR